MGQSVGRDNKRSVFRIQVPQMTFPVGVGGLVQTEEVNIDGAIKQIMVGVNDNTNNATVVVTIVDKATGSVIFNGESVAENTASAPVVQFFMTASATDFPLHVLSDKTLTITATISGDPGASTGLCDITLMGD